MRHSQARTPRFVYHRAVPKKPDDVEALIAAWQTNNRVTTYLIENIPKEIWTVSIPGSPRRTVRNVVAHLHNSRCMWIKMIGEKHGVKVPSAVDVKKVTPAQLRKALDRSSRGMIDLIKLGSSRGGSVPPSAWQNFPTDLTHFLAYFVAHEAHHRGQLILIARQLGHPLPKAVTSGLWQWKARARE